MSNHALTLIHTTNHGKTKAGSDNGLLLLYNGPMIRALAGLWMVLLLCGGLQSEHFAEVSEPDPQGAEWILGTWRIVDSQYAFEYTRTFAGRFYGITFYRYKTSQRPLSNDYIYAVLRIPKYKRSYLCRGIHRKGHPVTFSTSMIRFISRDWFKVYKQRRPSEVYFEAIRIR